MGPPAEGGTVTSVQLRVLVSACMCVHACACVCTCERMCACTVLGLPHPMIIHSGFVCKGPKLEIIEIFLNG